MVAGVRARVLLTAPHGGNQLRDGVVKAADQYTAALALLLAELTGAAALVCIGGPYPDPAWPAPAGAEGPALEVAQQFSSATLGRKVVLDLHGMRNDHGPDICLGLGASPSRRELLLAGRLVRLGKRLGLSVTVNSPFRGDRATSVTSLAQLSGVTALQIEIARRLRDPRQDPARVGTLVAFLCGTVRLSAQLQQVAHARHSGEQCGEPEIRPKTCRTGVNITFPGRESSRKRKVQGSKRASTASSQSFGVYSGPEGL